MISINPDVLPLLDKLRLLTRSQVTELITTFDFEGLNDESLLEFIYLANDCYRLGFPIIGDHHYDNELLVELQKRNPQHPFLSQIEPEPLTDKTVNLPQRMLSTDKAYTHEEMGRWLNRVKKFAEQQNNVIGMIKVTPKVDGFAAYDDGTRLYTRGDGFKGADITRVFHKGLKVGGDGVRGQGAGEIVINKHYFYSHLAGHFDNSRNILAAIIAEKKINPLIETAIEQQMAIFMPFSQLPTWYIDIGEFFLKFDELIEVAWQSVPFEVDGVIFEITDEVLKQHMGATIHHHRWQIAYKINSESAQAKVIDVHPQTSRSGRVNPVVEIEPTRLSGVVIRFLSAHHYGLVAKKNIGVGTKIELVRSGMVIPKIESVIRSTQAQIPEYCPSCNDQLVWDNDFLRCPNQTGCLAQSLKSIEHFFVTIGNIDGFGSQTIHKLLDHGVSDILSIYHLSTERLSGMGFGEKTSANLLQELNRSRSEKIQDWRFLAAFGIPRLGCGNSERLLKRYAIEELFDLKAEEISQIEGFAVKSAEEIVVGLKAKSEILKKTMQLGFSLERTSMLETIEDSTSPIYGKTLVFTGTMSQPRKELEQQARTLGAKIGASVTSKTDLLIIGQNVGESKIHSAKKFDTTVIDEREYQLML